MVFVSSVKYRETRLNIAILECTFKKTCELMFIPRQCVFYVTSKCIVYVYYIIRIMHLLLAVCKVMVFNVHHLVIACTVVCNLSLTVL